MLKFITKLEINQRVASIKELVCLPQSPDYFQKFIRPGSKIPIDQNRIDLSILCGDERNQIKTPTNGDSSLVLRYKQKEGSVLSMETETEELGLVQLQGSKSQVSYQVSTGILWVRLFGDQIEKIVSHPQSHFERISMPPLEKITGLDSGTDSAVMRYKELIKILGLRYSSEDIRYLKTLSNTGFFVTQR